MNTLGSVMTRRLMVIRFDWATTTRINEIPTPTITAHCNGIARVSTKVTLITVCCILPVFQIALRSSGLMVRYPTIIRSPASAGMAM